MNTVKIFLRTDQLLNDESHAVYVRLITNRRKKDVSLRIYVKVKDWNFNRILVNKSDPESERKNRLILKFKNRAENIVDDYFFRNETLSHEDFERILLNKEYSDDSFADFILDEIPKKNLSHESKKNYAAEITKLQKYRKNLRFSEINHNFIMNYKTYMIKELNNCPNTANKCLKRLKTFINWSIEQNLMKENPFKKIKITREEVKKESLCLSELEILEKNYYKDSLSNTQKNVLQYFLFVCYTGLRYSDIKNLKYSDIKKRVINHIETKFIDIKMQKTGLNVSIPLIRRALELMPKKLNDQLKIFKVLSNQKTNSYLKDIMAASGIEKKISFHCARHTFATNSIELGIPLEVVSKLLGHTDIRMTLEYAKVNDSLKYQEMQKLDKKANK